jgi:hypothetical protein
MKVVYSFLVFIFFLSIDGNSQVAVGLRGGVFGVDGNSYGGVELSVQKIGSYEFDLGWISDGSWKLTGLKQFTLIGSKKAFSLYGGGGMGVGLDASSEFQANFALNAGLSLRLIKILQLTLDYRPEWAITGNTSNNTQFSWNNIALGVRIAFE